MKPDAEAGIRFRILGPLEARAPDGRLTAPSAAKPRTLLALLLLRANQVVPGGRLAEALWPGTPPRTAAAALRTYVSTLRQALGPAGPGGTPRLARRPPGYLIEVAPGQLDRLVFDDLLARARQVTTGTAAADLLERALALWRGRPLDGVDLGPTAEAEIVELTERYLAAVEDWAQARLAAGRASDALPTLLAVGDEHPLRERLRALTMLALYRTGRQAEALAAYRTLRRHLVGELGIEPTAPVRRLHRQILTADADLDRPGYRIEESTDRAGETTPDAAVGPAPPATSTIPAAGAGPSGTATPVRAVSAAGSRPPPRQLPADIRTFTGRLPELAGIDAAVVGNRRSTPLVVAISGPGGVGKSALAVHAGHRLAHRFPDGQLYADLQGAAPGVRPLDPLVVLGRFLRALGATGVEPTTTAEAASVFRSATARRRLLVVLDNARDAAQVRPLLPPGPGCVALVTGRPVLATVDNAVHVHLDVLSEQDAMTLLTRLVGRTRLAAEQPAAIEVLRCCGRLPLAVRIAGARLAARPSWPVRLLADRLGDATRRLDELRTAELAVRSSFDVSHRALRTSADPQERAAARAYPLLGLADGPDLSLPAAAALLGAGAVDTERLLDRLVDGQLLANPEPGRYRLHDLLRLFARELAARAATARRQAALHRLHSWYVASAWQGFRRLRPADPRCATAGQWAAGGLAFADADAALRWLDAERANLTAAVAQAAATDAGAPLAIQLARALFGYFHLRGCPREWVGVNEAALAAARRTGDRVGEAFACRDLGAAHELFGEYPRAQSYLEEGLVRYRELGDRSGQAACLNGLGLVHDSLGELAAAAARLEQSLALSRELDDRHSQGISLNNLGTVYLRLDRPDQAATSAAQALAIFRQTGNRRSQGASLAHLSRACRRLGRHAEALVHAQESLTLFQQLGDRRAEAEVLLDLALLWQDRGEAVTAAWHRKEAVRVLDTLGVPEAARPAELVTPPPPGPERSPR